MGLGFFRAFGYSSVLLVLVNVSALAGQIDDKGNEPYPLEPVATATPGSLCSRPDSQRYAEHINYCNRNVSSALKERIFQNYSRLGYELLAAHDRNEFKIDHYIPLCAGGSNEENNLWPQHSSVYEVTDPLEQEVCEKMASGRLRQRDALRMIREGKADLSVVDDIRGKVRAL